MIFCYGAFSGVHYSFVSEYIKLSISAGYTVQSVRFFLRIKMDCDILTEIMAVENSEKYRIGSPAILFFLLCRKL